MTPLAPLLLRGDCLTELARIPDASVDAIVTDPPYGLANTDPAHVVEALTRWAQGDRSYIPEGRGFMGKAWDAFVPPPAVWDECMRILKPGGHLLAFAGSRTFDLMTLSIRFAGFDIRDSIAWLYGSGFPKSLDVSKAIDKRGGVHADFSVLRDAIREAMTREGITAKALKARLGNDMLGHYLSLGSQPAVPNLTDYRIIRDMVKLGNRFDPLFADAAEREVIGERTTGRGSGKGSTPIMGDSENRDLTTPATDAAREWEGWGTALKPAFEPIVVARKPLIGTVAANVLEHGTGAFNIDATRIEYASDADMDQARVPQPKFGVKGEGLGSLDFKSGEGRNGERFDPSKGRWPANVVLDESQAAALDEQAPKTGAAARASGPTKTGRHESNSRAGAFNGTDDPSPFHADSGGASRFFYVAKAPKSERPVVDGTAHPTVKPLALMRWLLRLVTPPEGVVVDPFAGSGTTLEAAYLEGFESIGCEMTPDYWPLIEARIERVTR